MNEQLSKFVYYDKYSRFNSELGRRETWEETVQRVSDFLRELSENRLPEKVYEEIHQAILKKEVAPSMRLFSTAGKEARRNHISIYNCAFFPVTSLEAFSELLWISMSGVGAGYSVEKEYVSKLPRIREIDNNAFIPGYTIDDSALGWVEAFHYGIKQWYQGRDVHFDYSEIRPAGAVLKTKGGTASGPGVLKKLMIYTRHIIRNAAGRQLTPLEVFDICTSIGSCAVSGGSRRSAQLCMFDINDKEMLEAKSGPYWISHPHRANANISAVLNYRLTYPEMKELMTTMFESGTGEPGIVSRYAMNKTRPKRRREMFHGGVNACSEINLQGATSDDRFGGQFCNLSTAMAYPHDTIASLTDKVRIAAIIGTIQAMATDFNGLRPEWKEICEEERLLGVSIIGIMDNEIARDPYNLETLQLVAEMANSYYAEKLGINPAAAVTCVKPSGNSSVLYGVARGINARYSPYNIRRVRVNAFTPMYALLRDEGVPLTPENDQYEPNVDTYVATFYEKAPDGAITMENRSALDQLQTWLIVKKYWCSHNPSVTIEYREKEQHDIVNWLYENQSYINGLSFLPRNDHIYRQAPYEPITKQEYYEAMKYFPEVDYSKLSKYEKQDSTERTIDCSAGVCDLF